MYGNFDNAYGKMKEEEQRQEHTQKLHPSDIRSDAPCANGVCRVPRPSLNQDLMENPSSKIHLIYAIPEEKETFLEILKQYPIVVVKAWASWCQPCKIASPKFQEMGQQFYSLIEKKHLVLFADNIDQPSSIHAGLVSVVPTFFVYYLGKLNEAHVLTGIDFEKLSNIIHQCYQHLRESSFS